MCHPPPLRPPRPQALPQNAPSLPILPHPRASLPLRAPPPGPRRAQGCAHRIPSRAAAGEGETGRGRAPQRGRRPRETGEAGLSRRPVPPLPRPLAGPWWEAAGPGAGRRAEPVAGWGAILAPGSRRRREGGGPGPQVARRVRPERRKAGPRRPRPRGSSAWALRSAHVRSDVSSRLASRWL